MPRLRGFFRWLIRPGSLSRSHPDVAHRIPASAAPQVVVVAAAPPPLPVLPPPTARCCSASKRREKEEKKRGPLRTGNGGSVLLGSHEHHPAAGLQSEPARLDSAEHSAENVWLCIDQLCGGENNQILNLSSLDGWSLFNLSNGCSSLGSNTTGLSERMNQNVLVHSK